MALENVNLASSSCTTDEDDLEKALVLAAADADARNNDHTPAVENTSVKHESSQPSVDVSREKKRKLSTSEDVQKKCDGYAKLIATHYNNIEEKGLQERSKSRIVYLRNFHNWIKSMLINEYLTKVREKKKYNERVCVMDLGCGKGGDLLKWKKGSITHLICTDIASISVDQCKSRYCDMQQRNERDRNPTKLYTIEYIVADCTKVRLREKYKDPSMKIDLVSCQFVFHYSFESLNQAEYMLHNAAECLEPGGYFIGTIPDSNDLVARARKANSDTFGNEVFNVQFDCDVHNPPLFGAKYHFQLDGVVDCPEFLVYFDAFVKLAKKYGLKFVRKEKFQDFYNRMSSDGRSLMFAMKGLETYPPHPNVSLVGTATGDYFHAEEFLEGVEDEGNYNPKVGTLSKSEWEASSLYITFAFQKVKNTWSADGSPLYDI